MKIYLNGSLWHSGTGKNQPIIAPTTVSLGSYKSKQDYYDGKIAHFRIYSKALTPAQILQDMNVTSIRLPVQLPPVIRPPILYGNVGSAYRGSRDSAWQCSPCLNGYRICVRTGLTAQPVRIESC